jgi:hypothetical protein
VREPRPTQRLPEGGLGLLSRLRSGDAPKLIVVAPKRFYSGNRKGQDNLLLYEKSADPMLFFWPVEGQHVVAWTDDIESESARRMERALVRDGAEWVTLVGGSRAPYQFRNTGSPGRFVDECQAQAVSAESHRED